MPAMSLEEFSQYIKQERDSHFITPFGLVYKTFCDYGYDKQPREFFIENASKFVADMRVRCWDEFVPLEQEFTTRLLGSLIDEEKVQRMSPVDAIKDFTMAYPQHIYTLSLSNTQSRRSRAGKEFEAIIELLLIGADVPADAQGSIGKQFFQKNQIGKLVDFVSPNVVAYLVNKRNTMLISAKTTLRERWQEVPEEVTRTGIREMYLATIDDAISDETLRILYEANIIIVTTEMIKTEHYAGSNRVLTFEDMIQLGIETAGKWNSSMYQPKDLKVIEKNILDKIEKYSDYPYVRDYYMSRLAAL